MSLGTRRLRRLLLASYSDARKEAWHVGGHGCGRSRRAARGDPAGTGVDRRPAAGVAVRALPEVRQTGLPLRPRRRSGARPNWVLTARVNGRALTRAIPDEAVAETRTQIDEYKRLRALTAELVAVSEALCQARLGAAREADRAVKKGASRKRSRRRPGRGRPADRHGCGGRHRLRGGRDGGPAAGAGGRGQGGRRAPRRRRFRRSRSAAAVHVRCACPLRRSPAQDLRHRAPRDAALAPGTTATPRLRAARPEPRLRQRRPVAGGAAHGRPRGGRGELRQGRCPAARTGGPERRRQTVERHAEALGREIAADERERVVAGPAAARTLYLGLDGTGVPVRRAETEGRAGKQPDGSAKTREAKLVALWSAERTDDNGLPVRDPARSPVPRPSSPRPCATPTRNPRPSRGASCARPRGEASPLPNGAWCSATARPGSGTSPTSTSPAPSRSSTCTTPTNTCRHRRGRLRTRQRTRPRLGKATSRRASRRDLRRAARGRRRPRRQLRGGPQGPRLLRQQPPAHALPRVPSRGAVHQHRRRRGRLQDPRRQPSQARRHALVRRRRRRHPRPAFLHRQQPLRRLLATPRAVK